MVANPNQRKNPVIRVVGSVASGNAGRGYRKVPSWWRDFCVSTTPLLKPNQQIMNTAILIATVLAVAGLAIWAVTKGEREKKARKLARKLVFDYGSKTIGELEQMIATESAKNPKDKVQICAVQMVIDHKNGIFEQTLMGDIKAVGKFSFASLTFAGIVGVIALQALLPTAIVGGILYLLSLVVTVVQFNWLFIGIIFTVAYIILVLKRLAD
jgi:hypothetical protein